MTPGDCSLIVITPASKELSLLRKPLRAEVRRNLRAVIFAAGVLKVPLFIYSLGASPGNHAFAQELADVSHREFLGNVDTIPWQNQLFRDALAAENKSVLILAGFWLEYQIVPTALHALADSYDVYVALDASPARLRPVTRLSQDRLIQAGATSVASSQVLHEWSLELSDVSTRATLRTLLPQLGGHRGGDS